MYFMLSLILINNARKTYKKYSNYGGSVLWHNVQHPNMVIEQKVEGQIVLCVDVGPIITIVFVHLIRLFRRQTFHRLEVQ